MEENPSQNDLDTLLAYFKEGKFNEVEKLAKSLTKAHPNHPFGWKALGIALKNKGEISRSLEVNKKVLEIDPKSGWTDGMLLEEIYPDSSFVSGNNPESMMMKPFIKDRKVYAKYTFGKR